MLEGGKTGKLYMQHETFWQLGRARKKKKHRRGKFMFGMRLNRLLLLRDSDSLEEISKISREVGVSNEVRLMAEILQLPQCLKTSPSGDTCHAQRTPFRSLINASNTKRKLKHESGEIKRRRCSSPV